MALCNSVMVAKSRTNVLCLPLTVVLQNPNVLPVKKVAHSKTYATRQERHRKHQQPNYYNVLDVSPKATTAQIKHAYYKLSKMYHPDRNKSLTAQKKFQEIQTAYETLGNPKLRQEYDGIKLPTKAPFIPKVKPTWKTASHPRGRASYNLDEHVNNHYSHKLKLHQQIKEETTYDRQTREKAGLSQEEPYIHKLIGIALFFIALASGFYVLPAYQKHLDDKVVKRMLAPGQRNENKVIDDSASR